jgi:hypothetical protein
MAAGAANTHATSNAQPTITMPRSEVDFIIFMGLPPS